MSPEDVSTKNYEQTQKGSKQAIVHIKEEGINGIKDRNHAWPYYDSDL